MFLSLKTLAFYNQPVESILATLKNKIYLYLWLLFVRLSYKIDSNNTKLHGRWMRIKNGLLSTP